MHNRIDDDDATKQGDTKPTSTGITVDDLLNHTMTDPRGYETLDYVRIVKHLARATPNHNTVLQIIKMIDYNMKKRNPLESSALAAGKITAMEIKASNIDIAMYAAVSGLQPLAGVDNDGNAVTDAHTSLINSLDRRGIFESAKLMAAYQYGPHGIHLAMLLEGVGHRGYMLILSDNCLRFDVNKTICLSIKIMNHLFKLLLTVDNTTTVLAEKLATRYGVFEMPASDFKYKVPTHIENSLADVESLLRNNNLVKGCLVVSGLEIGNKCNMVRMMDNPDTGFRKILFTQSGGIDEVTCMVNESEFLQVLARLGEAAVKWPVTE